MSDDWRNKLATEQQMEKLRFFGCTWDDGITAGQATDALTECARLFPDREAAWQIQKTNSSKTPGTFPVGTIKKLDKAISGEVTIQAAETVKTQPTTAAAPAFIPPPPEPKKDIEAPPHEVMSRTRRPHDTATQSWSWTSKNSFKFRPKQGLHPVNQESIKPQTGGFFSGTADPDPDDLAARLFREGRQNIILSPDAARRYIADQRFKLMNPKTGKRLTADKLGASRREYMISLHWQNAAQSAGVSRDASQQD